MSKLGSLIRDLCPAGVELRSLGDVGEFIRGRRITKGDFVDSGVGCIHYGEIYTRYGTTATETFSFVRPELATRLRLARTGDLIIAATGENAEDVCKAVAWLGEDEIAIHDDCYLYRHSFDPTFASYLFQSSVFPRGLGVTLTGIRVSAGTGSAALSEATAMTVRTYWSVVKEPFAATSGGSLEGSTRPSMPWCSLHGRTSISTGRSTSSPR